MEQWLLDHGFQHGEDVAISLQCKTYTKRITVACGDSIVTVQVTGETWYVSVESLYCGETLTDLETIVGTGA